MGVFSPSRRARRSKRKRGKGKGGGIPISWKVWGQETKTSLMPKKVEGQKKVLGGPQKGLFKSKRREVSGGKRRLILGEGRGDSS